MKVLLSGILFQGAFEPMTMLRPRAVHLLVICFLLVKAAPVPIVVSLEDEPPGSGPHLIGWLFPHC